jgi:polysaccharide export outer membrane protein
MKGLMMRTLRRAERVLLVLCLSVAACWLVPGERALSQTPAVSPDLIQMFQSLPPEQQDAIMKQLGLGGAGGILGALGGGGASADRQGAQSRKRDSGASADEGSDEENPAETAGLKGQDWVIVLADFPGTKPAVSLPSVPSLTAPAGLAAAIPGVTSAPPSSAASNAATQAQIASLIAASGAAPPAAPAPLEPEAEKERQRLQPLIDLIRAKNPYRLSRDGALTLPGFAPIPLLGLSDAEATLRLSVEPALLGLDIHLARLPLRRTGTEGLKPFGYDLFGKKPPSTFAPFSNVPVPADYIVGAGDEIDVQLYGNQNRSLKLIVGRDGHINLPDIGPVNVSGQHFTSVKADLEARIEHQLIGVRASVSMGDTRSIRVFVLGEAKRPGSYTLSGLGTVTSALYAAGGVKLVGSLRNVQLKRNGELVRRLDLYDLLIRGDTKDDAKLLEGDVIFIPPVGATVGVDGEVRRPAIYEIKGESTVADLIQLAGGLTPEADRSTVMLTRIDENQRRVVVPVDLAARTQTLQNGDVLRVAHLRPTLDSGILVQGHVYSSGAFAWHQGIRLTDVVRSVDQLRPNADIHYVLIRRETAPDRHVSVLSADLGAALAAPGSPADPELMPRDRIIVFDLESGRDRIIQPVMDELRLQSNAQQPSQVVHVEGSVRVPGDYPLEPGMKISDLIRAGGGTSDSAYGQSAELVRFQVVNAQTRRTELIDVDLAAALRGSASANLALQPFDALTIKEVPGWQARQDVTLRGEVRFPGVYAIRRGETLKSVVSRAGGLTTYAFPEGSVFTRAELKRREQEQLDLLAERMQRDLALLALQSAAANQAGAATALSVGQSLLSQLKGAQAVGRLVIDLPRLERAPLGSTYDVILHDGDTLSVPRFQQQVTVIGEVQTATSHLYSPKLERDDYIALSGGVTRHADRSHIYIVRANGSVIAAEGSRWFEHRSSVPIKPGDTIVVPLDTEHIPALPLWTQVTQILYNVAIAVLAVRSL